MRVQRQLHLFLLLPGTMVALASMEFPQVVGAQRQPPHPRQAQHQQKRALSVRYWERSIRSQGIQGADAPSSREQPGQPPGRPAREAVWLGPGSPYPLATSMP